MNTSELLRSVIDARGGIILDSQDEELLLLDRSVRSVLPLPRIIEQPLEVAQFLSLVDRFYARIEKYPEIIAGEFFLHVSLRDVLEDADFRANLSRFLASLEQDSSIDLVIHFLHPPTRWVPLLDWLFEVKKKDFLKKVRDRSIQIHVQGCFGPVCDEVVKVAFASVGARLGFVVAWWDGLDWQGVSSDRYDALSDLARFGFRIPLICYVHTDNIDRIWHLVEETLVLNQYSGFSLPLVCFHPEYKFTDGQPALPDVGAYEKQLVKAFDEMPYFADICYPINELAGLVGSGGWNERWEVPAHINLLAKPDLGIGMFRHVPAFARGWTAWPELLMPEGASLMPFLLERYREAFLWEGNAFCGRCQWRYVCGGTDGWDGRPASDAGTLTRVCRHRMELLEFFTREKIGMLLPKRVAR